MVLDEGMKENAGEVLVCERKEPSEVEFSSVAACYFRRVK